MPIRRLVACLMAAALLLLSGAAEAKTYPPLFGTKEIGSNNWNFKKGVVPDWRQMLGRWKGGAPCETNICSSKSWASLVAQVKGAGDPMAQIKAANALMNQKPYIEDQPNWGKSEFWATSYEFLKKSGDCEDYSITKYMLLKEAGIPVENMRIFSVRVRGASAASGMRSGRLSGQQGLGARQPHQIGAGRQPDQARVPAGHVAEREPVVVSPAEQVTARCARMSSFLRRQPPTPARRRPRRRTFVRWLGGGGYLKALL
jgi:predicted transglutaminase-like cysteine proteinase